MSNFLEEEGRRKKEKRETPLRDGKRKGEKRRRRRRRAIDRSEGRERQVERPRREEIGLTPTPFRFASNASPEERQESSKERAAAAAAAAAAAVHRPMLKSLRSLSLAAQIDVRPCFTFNSIGQKTLLSVPASPALCAAALPLPLPFPPLRGTPRCNR